MTPLRRFAAALTASLALLGCTKYQDMERIKTSIREGVQKQTGATVLWLECPARRAARPGDRFQCRAGIEGGAVAIDLVQDEYANVTWTEREMVLDLTKLETTIHDGLAQHMKLEAKVQCPGKHRPSIPGTRFECVATLASGPMPIPVVVKDTKGQVDWSAPRMAPTASPSPALTGGRPAR